MAKLVELRIKELSIRNRGGLTGKEDVNLLTFSLAYPRDGVPSVNTIKEIKALEPLPANFPSLPYNSQVIFKEKILGESQLSVDVAAVDNPSAFEKFLVGLFMGALKAAIGEVTSGIGNVVLAAASETAGSSLLDKIEAKSSTKNIGKCVVKIEESSLQNGSDIIADLIVPEDVTRKVLKEDPLQGKHEMVDVTILNKGQVNGQVIISCKLL